MSQSDTDVTALREQIREQQALLAEVLPELTAYHKQMKNKVSRSAIHQLNPGKLEELINRVAKSAAE